VRGGSWEGCASLAPSRICCRVAWISKTARLVAVGSALVVAVIVTPLPNLHASETPRAPWVDAWGAAPHSSAAEAAPPSFQNRTLRMILRLHAGGMSVRIRLSNTFGSQPVRFGRVRVAVRDTGAALVPSTNRPVRFGGATAVTVAAGAEVQSDPLPFTVRAGQDLAVSMFVPGSTGVATWHRSALQTSYVSVPGDHAGNNTATPYSTTTPRWFFVSAVSTQAAEVPGAIVTLGDSITDGSGSTGDTNRRWPDVLSNRLIARHGSAAPSVVNEGIAGNKVVTHSPRNGESAVARLDRDVLQRDGLSHVVLLEGINDIRAGSSAADIVAGYNLIIDRVHARGAKIYGGTILPFKGTTGYSPALERVRTDVNTWIRTSGRFDGVIDFAAAVRDPEDPLKLRADYERPDHLHPNDAGYAAMGNAVDLALFEARIGRPAWRVAG
jgi:lysophospholipase L1-like esterase